MILDIEDYFSKGCGRCSRFATSDCSTRPWNVGLQELRRICLEVRLTETLKWGHPCYMHCEKNIVIFGALRKDFRISFFHAALLKDEHALLEKSGPNTPHPDMIRFVENAQVTAREAVIKSYLEEAMRYAETGVQPVKTEAGPIVLPEELAEAMKCDAELADAFHRLTPGRQRSYVINLNSAKNSGTRVSRINKFRDKILAGKGAMER
jgi:uncharacterized protein YdeI (YjbR/CyaY-like superfamily)